MSSEPHVLIVEDEPAQREMLAYNVGAEGYRVSTAANGEEAILMIAEDEPDVVILDWMMPNLSGIEVCRRVKSRPETREISIIMLSARSEDVDRVRGLETGADDYVVKPYSVNELLARVRSQLRRTRPALAGQTLVFEDIQLDASVRQQSTVAGLVAGRRQAEGWNTDDAPVDFVFPDEPGFLSERPLYGCGEEL